MTNEPPLTLSEIAKRFVDTIVKEMQRPIAKAATAAIREAGEMAKRDGRASIAAAGFSRKWQNALRVNIYPPQGASMRPAAFIFHKIRYAGVFEEGAVIGGQPLLWLPLSNVPLRRGRPMTPSQYARSIGPLVSVQRPGGPPLLFPKYRSPRGRRRRAAVGAERKPLNVGLSSVAIAKALQHQRRGPERGGAVAVAICQAPKSSRR